MLCSVNQVKIRLSINLGDVSTDDAMVQLIKGISGRLAGQEGAGRPLEQADFTQAFDIEDDRIFKLWLPAWPVVIVSEIKESYYSRWSDATALVEGTDYTVDYRLGRVNRLAIPFLPTGSSGAPTVQIKFTAGWTFAEYWLANTAYIIGNLVQSAGKVYTCKLAVSGATLPAADLTHWTLMAGSVPAPDELVECCLVQCVNDWQRRSTPGQQSQGLMGGSASHFESQGLLPGVKEALRGDQYRRFLL